jgi:hypothetical protein
VRTNHSTNEVDTLMMSNFSREHAVFTINDTVLRYVLAYIDFVTIPETIYITGRPGIPQKVMLKCFIIQTHFGIAYLRMLVKFLKHYPYWCWVAGLSHVPHLSIFSRAAAWWRTESFSFLHAQVLKNIADKKPKVIRIDSTALRSSLYDEQAKWGKSTRYKWYKGYKLHLATTPSGVILAHQLTTANVYDSDAVPFLLKKLGDFEIGFALGDKAYDSKKVRKHRAKHKLVFLSPLNRRKGGQRKDAFGRVMPVFLKTTFGRALFAYRSKIEQTFSCLKNKLELEQPRWYGKNRYHFHCQLCVLIHNIGFLF